MEAVKKGDTSFQRIADMDVFSLFGLLACRNLSYLFRVMCLVCIQFSDCVDIHTQLIWTFGVQEFVLLVLGDLLGMFLDKSFVS
jgi:hypothetical protein